MRKLMMAAIILAIPTTALPHNPQNYPGMFVFGGYMKTRTAQQCQQILANACNREFGTCKLATYGNTLAVDFAEDQYNFSLQCTNFTAIGSTIYSVAGSAAYGHGKGLREIVVRIKTFIDNATK